MPAGVGDDEVVGLALTNPRSDRSQHIIQGARFVQINAGAVTGIMNVSVNQSRNDSLAMQVDSPRLRSDEFSYFLGRSYCQDLSAGNGQGLSGTELRVYFDDISINKYGVRRLAYGLS